LQQTIPIVKRLGLPTLFLLLLLKTMPGRIYCWILKEATSAAWHSFTKVLRAVKEKYVELINNKLPRLLRLYKK